MSVGSKLYVLFINLGLELNSKMPRSGFTYRQLPDSASLIGSVSDLDPEKLDRI
jgi:hypothetical protein